MSEESPYEKTPRGRLTRIGGWALGKTLGRGAYGHVRQATHFTGHNAACKILPALHSIPGRIPTRDQVIDAMEAHKEVVLLKALTGSGVKGIVGLEGVIEEEGWTYVFINICPLVLSSLATPIPEPILIPLFRHLLHAVHSLHKLHISHEDIKRHNVLLKDKRMPLPVLSDFGFSLFWPNKEMVRSCGGTFEYSSPQKVADEEYEPQANDIWALGITYCKLMGIPHPLLPPQVDTQDPKTKLLITEGNFRWPWDNRDIQSGGMEDFIMCMVQYKPEDRWSLLLHPYLQTHIPDPKPFSPPPLTLPPSLASRPLPSTILTDLCFLSYVAGEFMLCENMMRLRGDLLGNEPRWEKRWAGMLANWENRRELEWVDEEVIVHVKPKMKSVHRELKGAPKPAVLREIHLSPVVAPPTTTNQVFSPRKMSSHQNSLQLPSVDTISYDIPEKALSKRRATTQSKNGSIIPQKNPTTSTAGNAMATTTGTTLSTTAPSTTTSMATSVPLAPAALNIGGEAKLQTQYKDKDTQRGCKGKGKTEEFESIAVDSRTSAKVGNPRFGPRPKKVPVRSAFGRATISRIVQPVTTYSSESDMIKDTAAIRAQIDAALFTRKPTSVQRISLHPFSLLEGSDDVENKEDKNNLVREVETLQVPNFRPPRRSPRLIRELEIKK